MIDTVTKPQTKVKTKTERPRLHKVILVNDDFTPREFVVTVLKAEFRMTEDEAQRLLGHASIRSTQVYLNSRELHQMGEPNAFFRQLAV